MKEYPICPRVRRSPKESVAGITCLHEVLARAKHHPQWNYTLSLSTLVQLIVRNTIDRFSLAWYCALQCRHYVAKSIMKKKNDSTWYTCSIS